MNKIICFIGTFLIAGILLAGVVSAGGEAIIRTDPAQSLWVADGVTEYRMDVYADNIGLNGEPTRAAQWQLIRPQGLEDYINITRAEWPSQSSDFFRGFSVFFQILRADWRIHTKLVTQPGPANRQGILASYWFTVSPGFVGNTNFDFVQEESGFCRGGVPGCVQQPRRIENERFRVVAPHIKGQCINHNKMQSTGNKLLNGNSHNAGSPVVC